MRAPETNKGKKQRGQLRPYCHQNTADGLMATLLFPDMASKNYYILSLLGIMKKDDMIWRLTPYKRE